MSDLSGLIRKEKSSDRFPRSNPTPSYTKRHNPSPLLDQWTGYLNRFSKHMKEDRDRALAKRTILQALSNAVRGDNTTIITELDNLQYVENYFRQMKDRFLGDSNLEQYISKFNLKDTDINYHTDDKKRTCTVKIGNIEIEILSDSHAIRTLGKAYDIFKKRSYYVGYKDTLNPIR